MKEIIYGSEREPIEINEKIKESFYKEFLNSSYDDEEDEELLKMTVESFFEEIKKKTLKKMKNIEIIPEKISFKAYSDEEDFVFALNFKEFEFKKSLNVKLFEFGKDFLIESYAKVADDLTSFFEKGNTIKTNSALSPEKFINASKFLPWEKEHFTTFVSTNKLHLLIKKENRNLYLDFYYEPELVEFSDFFEFLKKLDRIEEINVDIKEGREFYKILLNKNNPVKFLYKTYRNDYIDFFDGLENLKKLIYRMSKFNNFEYAVEDCGSFKVENNKTDFFIKDNFFSEIIIKNSEIIKFEASEFMIQKMIEIFADDFKLNILMAKILINNLKIKENFSVKKLSKELEPEMLSFFLFVYTSFCFQNGNFLSFKNEDMFVINKIRNYAPVIALTFPAGNIAFSGFRNKKNCLITLKEKPDEPIEFICNYIKGLEKQDVKNVWIYFHNCNNIKAYLDEKGYVFYLKDEAVNNFGYIRQLERIYKGTDIKVKIFDFDKEIKINF